VTAGSGGDDVVEDVDEDVKLARMVPCIGDGFESREGWRAGSSRRRRR